MLLLTSRCGQGFFPVARSSDPDILLALVEIRGRFCAWAFPAWHAGPRVVRELILFCLCPLCVPLFLVPAFKLPSVCLPVPWDTSGIFERWCVLLVPVFFCVSASRVKSKRDIRLWYLFQCCRFQRPCAWSLFRLVPLLSPAVAGVGATSVLRNVWRCLPRIQPNSGDERESFSLLVDWDDQQ